MTKAYGSDGIPPRILRDCASELSPVFSMLFRLIFKSKNFPKFWMHSPVQPIPKSEDCSNPSNYRPISISCIISKVFKTFLNDHFLKRLENNYLLSDPQYDFRRARSTGNLLSYVTSIWFSAFRDLGESFVVSWTSPKHLTEYGMRHCFLNFLPLDFHLLSVLFYLIISQTDPSQLW